MEQNNENTEENSIFQIVSHVLFNGEIYYNTIDLSKSPSPAKLMKRSDFQNTLPIVSYWRKQNKYEEEEIIESNQNTDDVVFIGTNSSSPNNSSQNSENVFQTPQKSTETYQHKTRHAVLLTPQPNLTPNTQQNIIITPQPHLNQEKTTIIQVTETPTQNDSSENSQLFKIQQISQLNQLNQTSKSLQTPRKASISITQQTLTQPTTQNEQPKIQISPISSFSQPTTNQQISTKYSNKEPGKNDIHRIYSQMTQKQQKCVEESEQLSMQYHKRIILDTEDQEQFFLNFKENIEKPVTEKIRASVTRRHAQDESPYLIISTKTPMNDSNDEMEENLFLFEKLVKESSPNFVKTFLITNDKPFNS